MIPSWRSSIEHGTTNQHKDPPLSCRLQSYSLVGDANASTSRSHESRSSAQSPPRNAPPLRQVLSMFVQLSALKHVPPDFEGS